MQITNLRCEFFNNPMGLDKRHPRFSWQLISDTCIEQTAYQILVSDNIDKLFAGIGDWWDSGKVLSSESFGIEYNGRALITSQRLYWVVRIWSGDHSEGFCCASDPASFEMGLLNPEDWSGVWIGADETINAPLFRRVFKVDKDVQRARAYICGLGYFELHLNGSKVSDDVLVPNWTDYDKREPKDLLYPFDDNTRKRQLYLTYDITDALTLGENAIGAILGNGWYNQRSRVVEGKLWYGSPRFIAQVVITYTDGAKETISTDESWRIAQGPIIFDNIFIGEVYNAGFERPGWDAAGFDDSSWSWAKPVPRPEGCLEPHLSPTDKVTEVIKPSAVVETTPGTYVFDFGRNFSGWVRLKAAGQKGSKIVIRFAEETDGSGNLDFANSGGNGQIQQDVFILSGQGVEEYEPKFTWHGFRYAEITGLDSPLREGDVLGCVVHSDVRRTGGFVCSIDILNRIQDTYCRTQLSNYHGGVPSDCPHRERLGYTGDGHLTAEAAMYNFDVYGFYRKWLRDIADAQNSKTGFVPHTAPFYGGGGGPAWGSALVLLPWDFYRHYGDTRVLSTYYGNMVKWIDYLETRTDSEGIVTCEEPGSWCLGDWCWPEDIGGDPAVDLPPPLVNTAYYARCIDIISKVAQVIGKQYDAAAYKQKADQIRAALHKRFWDPVQGCYSTGRFGADVFPWYAGAIPPSLLDTVLSSVLRNIERNNGHLDTGILGTPILLDFLAEMGHTSNALSILTTTTYPSYGYMIENGATTLWETWSGRGSHSHPMFGSVSAWFFRTLTGIRLDDENPGYKHIIIQPPDVPELTHASAKIQTIRGLVSVSWRREGSDTRLALDIPTGTTATVGSKIINSGRHELLYI